MKQRIRQQIKATLAAMSPEAARAKSLRACKALAQQAEFRDARAVMVYLDIHEEVDTTHLILAAWQDDKTVLVPRVAWKHKHMTAVAIHSLDTGIAETPAGLREPTDTEPWPVEMIDLVITPALAFDRKGNRLGRGGGFYDRFLASPEMRAATCGLAFSEQLVDELPVSHHDYAVDLVVTDTEVLRFNSRSAEREQTDRPTDSMET